MTHLQLHDFQGFVNCETFFTGCPAHQGCPQREAQLNFFDLQASTPCCALCVAERPANAVLQVRRSSYHDVVKMQEISHFADISGIQGYTINSSKVIFLRRRPQPRPPKGAVGASLCTVCSRHLQDVSHYCSLQCKLDCLSGVRNVSLRKHSPGSLEVAVGKGARPGAATATAAHSSGSSARSSSGAPETPMHLDCLHALEAAVASSSDSEFMADSQGPGKRRKSAPLRAHFV